MPGTGRGTQRALPGTRQGGYFQAQSGNLQHTGSAVSSCPAQGPMVFTRAQQPGGVGDGPETRRKWRHSPIQSTSSA